MHPVGNHEHPSRMGKYEDRVNKYDFSSLRLQYHYLILVHLLHLSMRMVNNEKVIYPLRVSQTVVPDR